MLYIYMNYYILIVYKKSMMKNSLKDVNDVTFVFDARGMLQLDDRQC